MYRSRRIFLTSLLTSLKKGVAGLLALERTNDRWNAFLTFCPCFPAQVTQLASDDGEVTKDEFLSYAKHSDFFLTQMDKSDGDTMAAKREAVAKAERAFKLFDKVRLFLQQINVDLYLDLKLTLS